MNLEIKEAQKVIHAGLAWANWTDEQQEAMRRTALVEMDKQLPKKVTELEGDGGFCTQCHMHNQCVISL